MESYDKFPFVMNQLEQIVNLYESDFGEHDIQAILYMKKKAEIGHKLSKDISKLVGLLNDKFYIETTEDEAINQVMKLLINRTTQAENLLNHYRIENKRNKDLQIDNEQVLEQLKSTKTYIETCFESGFEINMKEVLQVLNQIIESGDM